MGGAEKAQLAEALGKVCALQKQYGKTQAELKTLVEGFCWVLADYPMPVILDALAQYIRHNSDIPAPADLVKIIDPPKPELSPTLYVKYQKQAASGDILLCDERAFCRAFEAQEMAKTRGGSEVLRDARREVEGHQILSGGHD